MFRAARPLHIMFALRHQLPTSLQTVEHALSVDPIPAFLYPTVLDISLRIVWSRQLQKSVTNSSRVENRWKMNFSKWIFQIFLCFGRRLNRRVACLLGDVFFEGSAE